MTIDHIAAARIAALIPELYRLVGQLEEAAPGRSFTPDGHMVGSFGEVLAAARYGLTLTTASTREVDAIAPDGREVEIKATGGKSIAMRGEPKHLLVLKLEKDGTAITVYNGPGALVWAESRPANGRNGQSTISLSKLRQLQAQVPEHDRLPEVMGGMTRDELKGAPLMLSTGRGLPPDPNEPDIKDDLAAWCAYHGIKYGRGPAGEAP
ncbi:hypothetical protein VB738_12730 [Cyanobium gracile UHCC 0139]|uniref:DUF6998 domain-containing protein n=1 Tax=Cyanobium gracile UHCC 0139 TaxID=3110308 RepID=A0ABU5RWH9_9CYAN|nr:hypothetical protein [Cyanobium gracile]MEA5392124.1 hypothetical protein [Cyanobium gracile UHCC 0139]